MKTVSITLLIFLLSFYSQAQNIRFIDSFSHHTDGSTRYVIVLENEEMYWRAPGQSWKQVTKEGLPSGTIDNFSTHSKPDGTRYIVTINGNRIFWRAAGESWNEVSNDQVNNSHWDDGTGTLNTLTPNRYAVQWVYIDEDGDI